MRANFTAFENVSYHLNATPLSVAVLAPCAWGENLVARQIRLGKRGEMGGVCGRSGQSENGAVFGRGTSLSLSLSLLALFAFALNLQGFSHTQILKQKFKFFTQNSRHFINSTHFITLSQILSPTQGFFIFLPQVFAQFLLINSLQRSSYGRQDTKAPF